MAPRMSCSLITVVTVSIASIRIQVKLVVSGIQNGVLEFLALVVVDEDVAHDGVQPSFDVGALFKVVLIPQCLHHGILNEVFSILRISRETNGKTLQKLPIRDQ